jgi:hypothetical protein
MAEEVESSDGKTHRQFPKSFVVFFNARDVGTNKRKHGEEYQHHAGIYMLFEFA